MNFRSLFAFNTFSKCFFHVMHTAGYESFCIIIYNRVPSQPLNITFIKFHTYFPRHFSPSTFLQPTFPSLPLYVSFHSLLHSFYLPITSSFDMLLFIYFTGFYTSSCNPFFSHPSFLTHILSPATFIVNLPMSLALDYVLCKIFNTFNPYKVGLLI